MFKSTCSDLEKDVKRLERKRQELEHMNEALMYEKLKINAKALVLRKELDILKDLSDKKEEELNTKIRELESESSKLKHNLESQMNDNKQLREQVQRGETDFTENRRWNNSSEALNWLNIHHNRNKKGLGFVNRHVTKPVDKKYIGLP